MQLDSTLPACVNHSCNRLSQEFLFVEISQNALLNVNSLEQNPRIKRTVINDSIMIDDVCITPLTVRPYVARAFLRSVCILLTLSKRQLWFLFHVKDHGNFLSHF